ncbi:MAG TPA: hypothetical protein RMF84_10005 [Polyangiaceae bacterium LLY-WYZ-14_1]|nr:hypothetical protein [Polyangiaceae bacterium LLY-WYZ-14_1]
MTTGLDTPLVRKNVVDRPLGRGAASGAARRVFSRLKRSALLRTTLTSVFILFMLAAAHLFMVVINAAEQEVAGPHPHEGVAARMFFDTPVPEEIQAALSKADSASDRRVLTEALARAEAGEEVVFRTLPVTPFIGWTAVGLCVVGFLLIWATAAFRSDTVQSILGIFGGNLVWTGGIEYGLTIAARTLGVGKAVGVQDGELVAIFGEYVLLKHTWGALALVMAYLLFLESSRCPVFLWWRRNVPSMRGPIATGRITNYGPRSAFQYSTTVWAFYLLLLWAYDEHLFGVYSLVTKGILFGSVAGSIYCVWRLHHQNGWGPAVRYAIAAMIVVWTPIEIFAKWGVLNEPWLLLEPTTAVIFFGGLGLGTYALLRAQRKIFRGARPAAGCPVAHDQMTDAAGGDDAEDEDDDRDGDDGSGPRRLVLPALTHPEAPASGAAPSPAAAARIGLSGEAPANGHRVGMPGLPSAFARSIASATRETEFWLFSHSRRSSDRTS